MAGVCGLYGLKGSISEISGSRGGRMRQGPQSRGLGRTQPVSFPFLSLECGHGQPRGVERKEFHRGPQTFPSLLGSESCHILGCHLCHL